MKKALFTTLFTLISVLLINSDVLAQVMKFKSNKVSVLEPGTNRLSTYNGDEFKVNSNNTIEFAETLIVVGLNDKKLGSQMLTAHPNGKYKETPYGFEIETKENFLIKFDKFKKEINFYFEGEFITMTFHNVELL